MRTISPIPTSQTRVSCDDTVSEGGEVPSSYGVAVGKLRLSQFRNYESLSLSCHSGPVIITGPNGAGKTNLLEAVSLLAPGRGLRSAQKSAFSHIPAGSASDGSLSPPSIWSVYAEAVSDNASYAIGTGLNPEQPEQSRLVRIDGQASSQSQLSHLFGLSWLTPQMDGLFIQSSSSRRRFIDRLAISFDPAHAGRVSRYEKTWRQRNRLLSEPQADLTWLSSLEQLLAETGVAIMVARMQLLAEICTQSEMMQTAFPKITGQMTGQMAVWLEQGLPAIDIEDRVMESARQNRETGDNSLPGPHEADLSLWFQGQPASQASTGEQKALLISMVLAHAQLQRRRLMRPPLLLLDDVAAHLDADRRHQLFGLCTDLNTQIWYSGTDEDQFSDLAHTGQFIRIENGSVCSSSGCIENGDEPSSGHHLQITRQG